MQQTTGDAAQPVRCTRTDGFGAPIWLGDDPVLQLREWSSNLVHALPGHGVSECMVGSDPGGLQLNDPRVYVSRRHARLICAGTYWHIEDLCSKNGVTKDREPCRGFVLVPGVEVGIGSLTLIAENQALVDLRGYLARVLGWDAARHAAINLAVRAIREAAYRRAPLVITGADDLVAVARQIHRRTTAPGSPFVVCGPSRHESDLSLRVTATHDDPLVAFEAATGGTICVRADELPVGFDHLIHLARDPGARTQLFLCCTPRSNKVMHRLQIAAPLALPRLSQRTPEDLQRIVSEYAVDAIHELDVAPTSFTEHDRVWVAGHAKSFADIEIATLRIVARNAAGNVHRAAARLGVSHVGLGGWFKRRGIKKR